MKKNLVLTKADTKTNITLPFEMKEEYDYISIQFQYTPDKCEDRHQFEKGVSIVKDRYFKGNTEEIQQNIKWEKYFPMKNLLTISLDLDGEYLGNAHRWDSNQFIKIGKEESTRGFYKVKKIKGSWNIMIHVHGINTQECKVKLRVEGKYND